MISKRLISLIAVAVAVSLVGAFMAAQRADAAIGVVRWWPEQVNPQQVKVHYRLNLAATSGKIEIFSAANALVKTITLAAGDLTRGNHEVLWDGTQDPSGVAPTGNYYAKITVSKGAVAEPGVSHRIRDHSIQNPTGHRYFGIDADNNPANNNQTSPALSTFGNIYINNTVSRNIEVWFPGEGTTDATGDYANILYGTLDLPGWASGWTAGSAPWGVAVGREGRVFSINRSVMSMANWKVDGSDLKRTLSSNQLGNSRDTDILGLTTTGLYQAIVSSNDKFGIKPVKNDYSYVDSYSDSKILATGYGVDGGFAQGIGLGNENAELMDSVFYVANSNQMWVKRWTVSGTGYADIVGVADAGFNLAVGTAPGNGPTDVAISPKDPNIAVITRYVSPNIEVWNLSTQTKIRESPIGSSGASKLAFDAWGNVLVTQGNYLAGVWAYMLELPDAGSSDTAQTINFSHQGGNTPPVIQSISFTVGASTANKLPLDDSTTTEITVRVKDVDGAADITQVCVDLSLLGYAKDCTPDSQTAVDAQTVDYKFLAVKAKGTSRSGVINLPAEAKDSQAHVFNATQPLYTSGGTLNGIVTHTAGFPVEGVNVSATDGTNVYTGVSGTGGAYSLEVNPGSFVVTASKSGYGTGTPSSATGVVVGGTNTPAVDAKVGSITIAQFRALPQGVKACVEAVVSAANYTPASTAYRRPKGYLRDSSGSNSNGLATPTNNLGLRFYAPSATYAEGDKVVVEGEKNLDAFGELMINNVTNFAKTASGQAYPDADVAVADDINDNVNNTLDNRWGSLVRLSGVTVASVTPNETANYHTMTVTDASSTTAGKVLIWTNTGITAGDLPAVGAVIDLTGVITRHESDTLADRWNVLEPRKLADIQSAIVDVASVGDARSKNDGTIVNLTGASVVTLSSTAEAGVFYMQSGGSGIRVVMPAGGTAPSVFDTVKVKGRIGTDANGERVIQNAEVTPVGTDTTVDPVIVINRSMGGKGYQGVAGVENYGLVNQGLLVKVFGTVTDSDFISTFWINDGSDIDGQDSTHTGIKVIKAEVFPSTGDVISVVGVVSSEIVGGKKIRVLRGREGLNPDPDYQDVETLAP